MKVIIKKVDDNNIDLIFENGEKLRINGNYGEGCEITSFNYEKPYMSINSQKDFDEMVFILEK